MPLVAASTTTNRLGGGNPTFYRLEGAMSRLPPRCSERSPVDRDRAALSCQESLAPASAGWPGLHGGRAILRRIAKGYHVSNPCPSRTDPDRRRVSSEAP